jgi:hypothetical protein
MQLNDEQKTKVAQWIEDGMKLSDIQSRMGTELGIRMTYMEARMLVDDLKLLPKDTEEPAKPVSQQPENVPHVEETAPAASEEQAGAQGQVSLSTDTLARPGALVSGKVTFSDGQQAAWYLDQFTGQLGMVPPFPGFKPSPEDVRQFQFLLERELMRQGL